MGRLDKLDYVLIIEVVLIIILGFLVLKPQPCTVSLDKSTIPPNNNFNQPVLTRHHCSLGEIPINIKDFTQ